jgi:hypothetical protein
MYNPPILALLTVGRTSSSSSSSSHNNDVFRMSLVDDPSSVIRVPDAPSVPAAGADTSSSSGGGRSSGGAADDADKDKDESGAEAFVFSIAACAEVNVAFDADFTEEWLPVTIHMLQLDISSTVGANSCVAFLPAFYSTFCVLKAFRYSKVDVEQLVVFSCRMVGHDVGELQQVLKTHFSNAISVQNQVLKPHVLIVFVHFAGSRRKSPGVQPLHRTRC